jgi:nitroimidazol reductase NimA-like FMN-containing flavoprotein (pyridoxamine 5'-phosphate oxidase superfamily)
MLGDLTPDEIERLLEDEVLGRIGCLSGGRPYVVPVCYAYLDGCVYGHTAKGAKWQAMRAEPSVCFEVEHVDDLSSWRSVIAWGVFEELDGADAERGMQLLVDRILPLLHTPTTPQPRPHSSTATATVYRIRLGEKTGRFENHSANPHPSAAPS